MLHFVNRLGACEVTCALWSIYSFHLLLQIRWLEYNLLEKDMTPPRGSFRGAEGGEEMKIKCVLAELTASPDSGRFLSGDIVSQVVH